VRNGEKGWEDEFPMREEVEDHMGRKRSFVIDCHEGGLGFTVRAQEEGALGDGYESPPTARPARTVPSAG
jgi:hypothetical protein